jgi:nucleoside-diphosphate-sugar epimerase
MTPVLVAGGAGVLGLELLRRLRGGYTLRATRRLGSLAEPAQAEWVEIDPSTMPTTRRTAAPRWHTGWPTAGRCW